MSYCLQEKEELQVQQNFQGLWYFLRSIREERRRELKEINVEKDFSKRGQLKEFTCKQENRVHASH